MAKFIELTLISKEKVYINVEHIGDFFEYMERSYHNTPTIKITSVGVLTHNNGGFRVLESSKEILNLINS